MRKIWLVGAGCGLLVALTLIVGGASPAGAQEGEPPAAHQALREYEGPEDCYLCHITSAREVAQSLHYQLQGEVPFREDWPANELAGTLSAYSVELAAEANGNWLDVLQPEDGSPRPDGCALCHAGLGELPNAEVTDADRANVDCLICHGQNYERTVEVDEEGVARFVPAEGVDVLASAQAAQHTTSETCSRCHLEADGGPNHKRGDYPTSAEVDVHQAAGLDCVDCHVTENHQISGGGDLLAHEMIGATVECSNCHTDEPHFSGQADLLNAHAQRVACQTCHIPSIARDADYPTVVSSDYSAPVLDADTGLYGPTRALENDVAPVYFWWSGHQMTSEGEPIGARIDPEAKIYPWKQMTVTVPADADDQTLLSLDRASYQENGDVDAAVEAGQDYSGSWEPAVETTYLSIQHQVAPASEALDCADCHSAQGRVIFADLGYSEDRAAELQTMVGTGSLGQGGEETSGTTPAGLSNDSCMACHSRPDMTMELASGEVLYLTVDEAVYNQSVHGQEGTTCVGCHQEITSVPHEPLPELTKRELLITRYYTACASCHEEQYEETLDSVHQAELAAGNQDAAICSDCHGAHDTTDPTVPVSHSSQMCEQCHSEIYDQYKDSVHGSALIEDGNADVPGCTDCHGVHRLEGPTTQADFYRVSYEVCADCHSDPVLMAKYGLNADVYDTYVADFHGTTVVLYEQTHPEQATNKPVCVDCHGVHDILVHDDPESRVMKDNLLQTCQRCHPGATLDFPASWLGHYRPDRENAPLVYYVDLFYKILIPAVLGFMVVFNATDVLRAVRQLLGRLRGRKEPKND